MIKNDFDFNEMKIVYEDLIINPCLSEKHIFFSKFKKQILLSQVASDTPSGILLYDSYIALVKTMFFFEEDYFYGLITEGKKNNECNKKDEYFLIDIKTKYEDYKDYIEDNFIFLENILFSSQKNWVLLLTQDFYGILASTDEFMKKYKENYPKWKSDIFEITNLYKSSSFFMQDILSSIDLKDLESLKE